MEVVKYTLCRLNLSMTKIQGQCYDGASGHRSGLAKLIMDEEPRAIYTHCYGHALNLAVGDAVKVVKDALQVTHEITKLLKFSPRRDAIFDKVKKELVPDSMGLCLMSHTMDC